MDKPQIIEHSALPLNYTIFDVKWIPCSAKFLVMGSKPKGTGVIQIFELNEAKPEMIKEIEKKVAFKCGSFGASSLRNRHLAVGDFNGRLQVLDLERPDLPVYSVSGHNTIINCIDAVGGKQVDCGPPEIVTGSRDGSVKVWDIRQGKDPVVDITPDPDGEGDEAPKSRDCWAVAFGDSYNNADRTVAAGYDNGDLRLFDLRALSVRWEKTEKNGIVSIEFDRKDIPMNKMAVTTLEGGLIIYDMRTEHVTKGFASVSEKNAGRSVGTNGVITGPKSTVWTVKHLPQNRDVFISCGGTGSVRLWEYEYPDKRRKDDGEGKEMGVAGTLNMINATTLSSQPVNCFDWNPDKIGLAVCGSFDQTVRVLVTTRMNIY